MLHPRFALPFSIFVIGMCGISYEYTFSKLASDILGNSAQQWAIIIGLMMFFMGIGADFQKYLPDRSNLQQFILFQILLALLGGFGPSLILISFGLFHSHFILIHYFLIISVGFLIGLEIPLMLRINEKLFPELKKNIGLILKMDYIGAFIGSLCWIFLLPIFFTLIEISYFLGLLNGLIALFTWFVFKHEIQNKSLLLMFIIITLLMLSIGFWKGKSITSYAEQRLYLDPIILSQTTKYQHLVMTQRHNGDVYFYINGNLQFSSVDEYIYHEFLVHPPMLLANQKKNILILGGGDGLAVREVLKYEEVATITLVDIDPEMTKLAQTNPQLIALNKGSLLDSKVQIKKATGISSGELTELELTGTRFFLREQSMNDIQVHIYNIDAFQFVNQFSEQYDVIIIDFPDPNNPSLSKLYSLEFYSYLKKRLSYNGVLIQQSTSPSKAKETFLTIGRTMKSAGFSNIPFHHNIPSFGDWGWWIARHEEFGSSKLLKQEIKNIPTINVTTRYLTKELLVSSLFFGRNALQTNQTQINTTLQDTVYPTYLKEWKQRH